MSVVSAVGVKPRLWVNHAYLVKRQIFVGRKAPVVDAWAISSQVSKDCENGNKKILKNLFYGFL